MIVTIEHNAPESSHTTAEVSTAGGVSARLIVRLRVSESGSASGARVELDSSLALASTQARLGVRMPAAHAERAAELTLWRTLVTAGRGISAFAHPLGRRLPAGSRLALRALDHAGHPLAPQRDVGPCEDGATEAEIPVVLDARFAVRLDVVGWTQAHGFVVGASSELTLLQGLGLRLESRGADQFEPGGGRDTLEWPVIAPGRRLHGSTRELRGLAPGALLVVRFLDDAGHPIEDERVVGRCALE